MGEAEQVEAVARSAGSARRVAFRVSSTYLVIGILWIIGSGYLISLLPDSIGAELELFKGALFVVVTAGILWLIIRRWASRYASQVDAAAGAELKFEQVIRMLPVGIVLADRIGRVEFLNPAAERMLSVENSVAVGRELAEVVIPLQATMFSVNELMRVGGVNGLEMRGAAENATTVLIASGSQLESRDGSHEWVIALTDVSDAHREGQRTTRLVSGYRFISRALHLVDRAHDRTQLFTAVCSAAVDEGQFAAAWVVAPEEKTGALRTIASAGLGPEMLGKGERIISATGTESFNHSVALPTDGEMYVVNDLAHGATTWLHEMAASPQFGSSAVFVIGGPDAPVVILTLFSAEVGFFDQDQIGLIGVLREATAFALDKLTLDAKRLRAEESLFRSEAAYRDIFVKHPQPMWIYDRASLRFLAVNDAAVRKYGYSREEFETMTILDIRPPEDLPRILSTVAHYQPAGMAVDGYWTHIDKSGRSFAAHVHSNSVNWQGADARLVQIQEVPVLD